MAELIQKTDTLNEGREKLNEAIKDAEKAKEDSSEAIDTANTALSKSDSTQTQLDNIVVDGDSSVEAAQARVDEKGQSHTTLKERIDDGFTKVNTQLAENVTYIPMSTLGLGEDGTENLNAVLSSLTKNNIYFVVDGDYPISTYVIQDLEYDFNLISFTNGSLIFDRNQNETFFNTTANVRLEGVSFVNTTDQTKILFTTLDNNNTMLDTFSVKRCRFEGSIRLSYLMHLDHVNTVEIESNDIKNTTTSFFQTSGFSSNLISVKNNTVENWFYRAFSMSNPQAELVEILNNRGYNTENWVFTEETDPGTYYVFALAQGKEIVYKHNKVRGMKALKSIALYDFYGNTPNLTYEHNDFKNNVCIDPSRINQLMKCKNEDSIKKFNNNRYVIEDSFLQSLGVNPNNFRVRLYDIWGGDGDLEHTKPVELYISYNTIKVPNLDFEVGLRLVKVFAFENNIIETNITRNSLIYGRLEGATIKIVNNTIENLASDNFVLVNSNSNTQFKKVEIKGNEINHYKYIASTFESEKVTITENRLGTTATNDYLTTYVKAEQCIVENNTLLGDVFVKDLNNATVFKQLISKNKGVLSGANFYVHQINRDKDREINVIVKTFGETSIFKATVTTDGRIKFRDINESDRDVEMLSGNAHGIRLKNYGKGDTYLVIFNNTTTGLSIVTPSETICEIEINVS